MDSAELLDNLEKIQQIDKGGMLAAVAKTPAMMLEALALTRKVTLRKGKKFRQIVISGMGGSAIAGNIVADLFLNRIKVPIYVNRGYKLPAFVESETLIFALSYSGNTEETLSAVKEAKARNARVICITSGGKLKELAEKNGYPLFLIPAGYQPRAALPYLLIPVLKSMEQLGFPSVGDDEITGATGLLNKLNKDFGPNNPLRTNLVKQLASKLHKKIPIIFGVQGASYAAGLRFKTQLNENGKVTALFNVFPELNHNETVNLAAVERGQHDFALVFLRSEADPDRIKKRIEITKSLIGAQLGGVNEVNTQGKTPLARLLSLVCFGDFLSVYLALMKGIDPTEVDVIARLKKELAR